MNADLKLRLRPLHQTTRQEDAFLRYLIDELGEEALLGSKDAREVNFLFEYIENGEDDSAYVTGDGETFDLHLDKRMPFGMVVDFILHELAHIHSWDRADEKEDHCDEFGKSYALLYRLYLYLYENFWSIY
jgi:hypothetical protein